MRPCRDPPANTSHTQANWLIGADADRCAAQGSLAVYLWLGHPTLWFVVGGSVLGGIATAMFQPGTAGLVPQVSADPTQANEVLRVSEGASTMAGPAIAGVLVATTSTAWVFVIDAATFAVSGICLPALAVRLPRFTSGRQESAFANLREGWQEFRSRSWLWAVILIWWVLGVCVRGPPTPLGAASVIAEHGKAAFGYAEGAFGAGCVLGGLVAIRIRPARPLLGGAVAMFAFPMMPLAAALVPPAGRRRDQPGLRPRTRPRTPRPHPGPARYGG